MEIKTPRLVLRLESLVTARAKISGLAPADRKELSPAWLALLDAAEDDDPWVLGFEIFAVTENAAIGQCGFKGSPSTDGMVEIAYAIETQWHGQGFATESSTALTQFALQQEGVQTVRAHTLPESNASGRVLSKCGFVNVGEVIDPDDGPVWRWEKRKQSHA